MQRAINVPNFGAFGDARVLVELAQETEAAGWDGFFLWDFVTGLPPHNYPVADPWTALAAVAMATERIRIGPMVTPLPRRRPWQVARQAVTLDRLSGGRLTLGVGIGVNAADEYSRFGEPADDKTHGAQLDEALDVITGLWSGQPFEYTGTHYTVEAGTQFLPTAVQQPRIPIWVAGAWPGTKPFRRAAQYEGVTIISKNEPVPLMPDDIRALVAYVERHRTSSEPFEIVYGGVPLTAQEYRDFADAGVTWFQDGFTWEHSAREVQEHIRRGPGW
jgi:alkanesulfonate monooxygenase SsuD/methylene tetrahydromethanopterin reductase-like flavin-dependent oxidoreductase (luciferase family)